MDSSTAATRSLARSWPSLLLVSLMFGHMSQGLTFTAYNAALPQMARDLGPDGEFIAQMSIAIAALGVMIGALASGWILKKGGARTTMLLFLVIYGLTGTAGYVVRDPVMVLGMRFVVGFAGACMVTACVWRIAAEYTGPSRARVLGASVGMASFVSLVSTLIRGFLAQKIGWPYAFLQYPVFALLGFVLVFVGMRQAKPEPIAADQEPGPFFLRLLPFYLLTSLLAAVIFMGSTQFSFLLQEVGVTNSGTRSIIMGIITVMSTIISFCYGAIYQRLGSQGSFVLGLFCVTFGLASIGAGMNPLYSVFGAILFGVFVGIVMPYIHHSVTEQTNESTRGHAIGILNTFNFLGAFLNPLIFAPLAKLFGLHNVFLGTAVVMFVLCMGAILKARQARVPANV